MSEKAPERIYLQSGEDGGEVGDRPLPSDYDGVTWCQDRIFTSDVEYVRADKLEQAEAEAERLRKQLAIKRGVPEGWKVVPKEPTDDMQQDGYRMDGVDVRKLGRAYGAMIAAAPDPQEGQE